MKPYYLEDNFDPKKLTKQELLKILSDNGIPTGRTLLKAEILEIFEREIRQNDSLLENYAEQEDIEEFIEEKIPLREPSQIINNSSLVDLSEVEEESTTFYPGTGGRNYAKIGYLCVVSLLLIMLSIKFNIPYCLHCKSVFSRKYFSLHNLHNPNYRLCIDIPTNAYYDGPVLRCKEFYLMRYFPYQYCQPVSREEYFDFLKEEYVEQLRRQYYLHLEDGVSEKVRLEMREEIKEMMREYERGDGMYSYK